MSPVDPVSPSSPMNYSPSSPATNCSQFRLPTTPVITSSNHLPKLVTSFRNSMSMDNYRRLSTQFQLATPSPLSLKQTPKSARRSKSSPWLTAATNAVSSASPHNRHLSSPCLSRTPILYAQDMDEGPDLAQHASTTEQAITLPLRTVKCSSPRNHQLPPETQVNIQNQSSTISPSTLQLTSTRRVRQRSPIKHTRQRRRLSKTWIRKQTPNQRQCQIILSHLQSQLVPLISVRTGRPHPDFPRSLLQYHLLTHDQLDSMARWYHQTVDSGKERWDYPCPVEFGKAWCGSIPARTSNKHLVDLETKRRRMGRFIGLKGCESPVTENIADVMDREWREASRKAEEDNKVSEKIWGRRIG